MNSPRWYRRTMRKIALHNRRSERRDRTFFDIIDANRRTAWKLLMLSEALAQKQRLDESGRASRIRMDRMFRQDAARRFES